MHTQYAVKKCTFQMENCTFHSQKIAEERHPNTFCADEERHALLRRKQNFDPWNLKCILMMSENPNLTVRILESRLVPDDFAHKEPIVG